MTSPDGGADGTRIGVSILVPEPFADELQRARRSFGDPLADSIPPHITLVGPTVLTPDGVADAIRHLDTVAARTSPFGIYLRGSATFRPVSPVVFIQVVQGIAECEQLEAAARSGPLEQDLRFNYHPHVTVAHQIDDTGLDRAFAEMADFEAAFEAASFHLFEHGDDGVWRPVQEFPLGAGRRG